MTTALIFFDVNGGGETLFSFKKRFKIGILEKEIRLWNLHTGEFKLLTHEERVYDVWVSHDGQLVVDACGKDGVTLWNMESGESTHKILPDYSFSNIICANQKQLTLISHANTKILVWNLESDVTKFLDCPENIICIAIGPDASRIVTVGKYVTATLFDPSTSQSRVLTANEYQMYEKFNKE